MTKGDRKDQVFQKPKSSSDRQVMGSESREMPKTAIEPERPNIVKVSSLSNIKLKKQK